MPIANFATLPRRGRASRCGSADRRWTADASALVVAPPTSAVDRHRGAPASRSARGARISPPRAAHASVTTCADFA